MIVNTNLFVTAAQINTVSPLVGATINQTLDIFGINFGTNASLLEVYVDRLIAEVQFSADDHIQVLTPPLIGSGLIVSVAVDGKIFLFFIILFLVFSPPVFEH